MKSSARWAVAVLILVFSGLGAASAQILEEREVDGKTITISGDMAHAAAEHAANISRATKLYNDKQYAEAAALYAKLTTEDPRNGNLWIQQGRAYSRANQREEAIKAYSRASELGFGTAYISINIAALYAGLNNQIEALKWIELALRERLDGRTGLWDDPAFASLKSNPRFRQLAAVLPQSNMSREQGWRFDIDLLVEEAQRLHASPRRESFSPAFLSAASELRNSIATSTDDDLTLGVERLVVMLNDGHSSALPAKPLMQLQADLYEFSDGIFVIDGTGSAKSVIGKRVLRIGGKDIDWLVEQIRPYQPHDNETMYKWTMPIYVTDPLLLRHFGALLNENETSLTVQDADGRVAEIKVAITSNWHQTKLFPSRIGTAPIPLYLKDVGSNFWYEKIPDHSALYLQINQLWQRQDMSLDELGERLLKELSTSHNLIIDVRHDNGGNGYLARSLVRTVAAFEQAGNSNHVYVITGRNTFSAGQILISQLERFTNAQFLGEPSSSRPNFTGEDGDRLVLPYSRMKVNISYKYHQNSAFDDSRQFIPVIVPVELSSSEYFRNQDRALDAVFELIEQDHIR